MLTFTCCQLSALHSVSLTNFVAFFSNDYLHSVLYLADSLASCNLCSEQHALVESYIVEKTHSCLLFIFM